VAVEGRAPPVPAQSAVRAVEGAHGRRCQGLRGDRDEVDVAGMRAELPQRDRPDQVQPFHQPRRLLVGNPQVRVDDVGDLDGVHRRTLPSRYLRSCTVPLRDGTSIGVVAPR
jgi:hypothetical protein